MPHLTPLLLQQAQAGQETAIAAVLAHMMPMLRRWAAQGVCPGLEYDDAVQEGIIGLFSAVKMFDASRGAAFETYASTCIQNAVIAAQRAAGRKKHGPLNQSVPLEENHPAPGPDEIAHRKGALNATIPANNPRHSRFAQEVLALFIDGNSYEQIARQLGRTPKAVENALFRLRRKLRQEQPASKL